MSCGQQNAIDSGKKCAPEQDFTPSMNFAGLKAQPFPWSNRLAKESLEDDQPVNHRFKQILTDNEKAANSCCREVSIKATERKYQRAH